MNGDDTVRAGQRPNDRGSGVRTPGTHAGPIPPQQWPRRWRTTRLSLVLAAAEGGEPGRRALAELYQSYFYPVYALIAAREGREAAEELTQAFFVDRMVKGKDLAGFDRAKCRKFRSWLYQAVESFLKNEWKRRKRKCRDLRKTLALDFEAAEIRYLAEPALDPERRFNRAWALCLLSDVIARLRDEYCESVRETSRARAQVCFDTLKIFLPGPELDEPAYAGVAEALGMSTNCVKQRVFHLRERFGELLREHVAELVADDAEIETEIQFLCEALTLPPSHYELMRQYRQ